jgi:hypothetical protein
MNGAPVDCDRGMHLDCMEKGAPFRRALFHTPEGAV